jgi:hypothetical protein
MLDGSLHLVRIVFLSAVKIPGVGHDKSSRMIIFYEMFLSMSGRLPPVGWDILPVAA